MQKRGLTFGNYHTAKDWGLILTSKTYTPPTPKTNYVDVDGRDGSLDLTEALTGEVKYETRKGTYKFVDINGTYQEREDRITEILKTLHGRELKIMIDDDELHYMLGRCTITALANNNAYCEMTIETKCEPWKYHILETVRTVEVNGQPIELPCVNTGVKTVTPELKVTGTVNIKFDNANLSLSDGTYKVPELRFKSGLTVLTVSGTGTLVVTYREAIL